MSEIDVEKLNPPVSRGLQDTAVPETDFVPADEPEADQIDVAAINDFYKQIVPFETAMFQGSWQAPAKDAEDTSGMLLQTFTHQKVQGAQSEETLDLGEILRAVNSGKARIFLFRTLSSSFQQMGSLLPYFNQYGEDDEEDLTDA